MRIELLCEKSDVYIQAQRLADSEKLLPVRKELILTIRQAGGPLSDLWSRGIEADCMSEDADPDRLRLVLAQHMLDCGYHIEEFYRAEEQWPHPPADPCDFRTATSLAWFTAKCFHPVTGRKINPAITLRHASDNAPVSDAWLLQDMLPAGGGVGIIGGQSGAGKTFIAASMASALACGTPCLGHANQTGRGVGVLYIAAEEYSGVRLRMDALKAAGVLRADAPLVHCDLPDEKLIEDTVASADQRLRATNGTSLRVCFIDTFAKAFNVNDEADNSEVSRLMTALERMASAYGIWFLVLHHYGKTVSAGPRGASAFLANAACVLSVTGGSRDPKTGRADPRFVHLVKAKDAEPGPPTPFTIRSVSLGHDPATGAERLVGYAVLASAVATGSKPTKWHLEIVAALTEWGSLSRADLRNAVGCKATQTAFNKVAKGMLDAGRIKEGADRRLSLTGGGPAGTVN